MANDKIKTQDGSVLTPMESLPATEANFMSNKNFLANQAAKQLKDNLNNLNNPKDIHYRNPNETLEKQLEAYLKEIVHLNNTVDKQNKQISELQEQLKEPLKSKVSKRVLEILLSVIGGVLLSFILYFVGKWLGISL